MASRHFVCCSKGGTYVYEIASSENSNNNLIKKLPSSNSVVYSNDGSLLAVLYPKSCIIYKAENFEEVLSVERPVSAISFSPKLTFVTTWEPMKKEPNMLVWSLKSGECVARYAQKQFEKEFWPYLQWAEDEVVAFRTLKDKVWIVDGMTLKMQKEKMLPKVATISVAPGPAPYKFAAFVGEVNGAPATVSLFCTDDIEEPKRSARFYRADRVYCNWNSSGTAVLVRSSTDRDKTGASYYGESRLHLLSLDKKSGESTGVDLDREGPIHDVQWSPEGRDFVAVYGKQPAKAASFDMVGRRLFSFGDASRNQAMWAPHGRFLMLAGFGNLAGGVQIWEKNKQKLIAALEAHCTVNCQWSPCSRYFLTATCFPRLRVDNGYRIWTYAGETVLSEKCDAESPLGNELYQVCWRPLPVDTFPDRPISPRLKDQMRELNPEVSPAAGGPKVTTPAAPAKAVYRPPHRKGSASFTLHDDVETSGREKMTSSSAGISRGLPVGAVVEDGPQKMSKSALKNKKRNAKRKAEASEKASPPTVDSATPTTTPSAGTDPGADEAKRTKNLTKKLRQVEQLKQDLADGKSLNEDQMAKIASEESIRKELASLSC